ncbi:MAG: hypothetical protein HY609_03700 [Deltaproteobacteria bacterium]|nr:hypothetical protein [Deltaproteobacteria bacterium]
MVTVKTEILSVYSREGNDPETIDLNDMVTVRNVIDGEANISTGKVEWIFGNGSNYFLEGSISNEKRLEMIVEKAKKQKAPYTVSPEVRDYINKYKQKN